jgi:hypothetical protein
VYAERIVVITLDGEERSLARVDEGGRVPDAYERKYMAGEGLVLHRAKARAPGWMQAILLLPLLAVVPTMLAPGGLIAGIVVAPIVFLLWVLFSVLRVTVSEGHVNIQYGLFGPKIPIPAIESAEATLYEARKFGGWGIKRSLDGEWIYNMPGDAGRAVRIVWRDAKGRRRVTWIGTREHLAIADAIAKARRALPEATPAAALGEGDA